MNATVKKYYWTGATIALASTAAIVSYAVKKAKQEKACVGLLLAGLAGMVGSVLVTAKPARDAVKGLTVENLLDENDTDLMQMNISEILGNAADRGKTPEKLRHIELDEEATIEDFI